MKRVAVLKKVKINLDGCHKVVRVLVFPPMRYIIIQKRLLPKNDPAHANPFVKEWCIEDTQEGYINTSFSSLALAEKTAARWNNDSDEE
jgi:hypothetical protein